MGGSSSAKHWQPSREPGGPKEDDDCLSLQFPENLQMAADGPVHAPGTVLEVMKTQAGSGTVLVAVDDNGEIVGSILNHVPRLLRCMNRGIAYVAQVLDATANVNRVSIRPADDMNAVGAYDVQGTVTVGRFSVIVESRSDMTSDVRAESNVISRDGICELRSLLRADASFEAQIDKYGSATIMPK